MKKLIVIGFSLSLAAATFGKVDESLFAVKPNSAKGSIAIVNRQTKISQDEFVAAVNKIRRQKPFIFQFVDSDEKAKEAAVQIRIVDEAGKPPMTVSPEIGRGEMNVAALVKDIKSEAGKKKFLVSRARRELMRTIAYSLGAGGTKFPNNIMATVLLRELDFCDEALPVDTLDSLERNAEKFGLKPEYIVPYEIACEQGWAPAPTNDVQKAIWDEVHAIPKKPMKIEFDPKKGL